MLKMIKILSLMLAVAIFTIPAQGQKIRKGNQANTYNVTNDPDEITIEDKTGEKLSLKSDYNIVTDTTALKAFDPTYGQTVFMSFLAVGSNYGSGWFRYFDSTYTEGVVAFNSVNTGYQWIRVDFLGNKLLKSSWTDSLSILVDIAGSSNYTIEISEQTIYLSKTTLTVPNNVHLVIRPGGLISASSAKNLILNCSVDAGLYKIFDSNVTVTFGGGSIIQAYPQWWGAVVDDANDDSVYIDKCFTALYSSGGGVIRLSSGTWKLSELNKNWSDSRTVDLIGDGKLSTIISKYGSETEPMINFSADIDQLETYSNIKDLSILGNSQSHDGIALTNCARFLISNVDIRDCDNAINSIGSLVYTISKCTFADNNIGILTSAENSIYANHIAIEYSEIVSNDTYGISFAEGSNLQVIGCDIELNGTTGDTATGGVLINNDVDSETGFCSIAFDKCWFEANNGIAFKTEEASSIQDVFLIINDSKFLASEDGNALSINHIEKFSFINSSCPSASGDTLKIENVEQTFFVNCRIISLIDNSNSPVHLNVDQRAVGLSNYGFTSDVYLSTGKGLYFTWANGVGVHSIVPNTSTGDLEVDLYGTNYFYSKGKFKADNIISATDGVNYDAGIGVDGNDTNVGYVILPDSSNVPHYIVVKTDGTLKVLSSKP